MDTLRTELEAWQTRRNDDGATIKWLFSAEDARAKLGRAYPKVNQS